MKTLKVLGRICLAIAVTTFGVIEIVVHALISLWNRISSGKLLFSCFYQPLIVLITYCILLPQVIYLWSDSYRFMWIMILSLETMAITFFINTITELIFCLLGKEDSFCTVQEIQIHANSYALIFISLFALYVAVFFSNSEMINFGLLLIGGIYFVSTISSDAYKAIIHSSGAVKNLAERAKKIAKDACYSRNVD